MEWPFQGVTRQVYLEAKVLELLALHLDQILPKAHLQPLPTNEVDRIH